MPGAVGSEILRHRGLDVLHGDGGAPAAETRRDRRKRIGHEQIGLQQLDGRGPSRQRQQHIGQDVERQRPDHAVHQGRQIGAEQRLRPQRLDAERTVLKQQDARCRGIHETRNEQRVEPHREADQHAADGAARGRAPPQQPAEEARRKLRDGGKGEQADRHELGIAERAIVEIGHHHDGEDREPARAQQEVAEIRAAGASFRPSLQHQRHHEVVRDHDGECDAFDDHHRGRRRQAADENGDAEKPRTALHRQRQHVHVRVGRAEREGDEAGERDRDHEQIDGDEIEREQPARAADLGIRGVLDHADVELARQQHDRAERQQRHGEEVADRRRIVDGAHRLRRLHGALDQFVRREHPEGDEDAGGEEGDQLDDGFGRDRQHQAVLMLGRVGLTRPEQHREGRHRQRHHQRDVADDRDVGEGLVFAQDRFERGGDRLELERDVGHRADDRDQCHGRRHRLALAVARPDEVGDRGDVVGFRQLDHAAQHAGP
ncbi:hypothetical protein ABIF83_007373 [Bradyrhizobium ottawaense]